MLIPILLVLGLAAAAPLEPTALCQQRADRDAWGSTVSMAQSGLVSLPAFDATGPPDHGSVVAVSLRGTTVTWTEEGRVGDVRTWANTADNPEGGYWPEPIAQSLVQTAGPVLVALADDVPWRQASDLLGRIETTGRAYELVVAAPGWADPLTNHLHDVLVSMNTEAPPFDHPILVPTKGRYGTYDYQSTVDASMNGIARRCAALRQAVKGRCEVRAAALTSGLPSCAQEDQARAMALFSLSVGRGGFASTHIPVAALRSAATTLSESPTWSDVLRAATAPQVSSGPALTLVRLKGGFSIPALGPTLEATVQTGQVRPGDELEMYHHEGITKVRVVAVDHRTDGVANPGTPVMLQVEGDPSVILQAARDGAVLASPGALVLAKRFLADITMNGQRQRAASTGYRPQVFLHGVQTTGTLTFTGPLEPGASAAVQIELVATQGVRAGQSFELFEGGRSVGSGVVTKVLP